MVVREYARSHYAKHVHSHSNGYRPAAQEVSAVFDRYWNSELAYPISVYKERSADRRQNQCITRGLGYELNKKLSREERREKKGQHGSSKASLHAKSFVFDRKQVFIGSLNLDPRAWVHNTEIGVVLNVPAIAEEMADAFDENIEKASFKLELRKDENGNEQLLWHGYENGKPVVFTHDPYTSFWRRFGIGFMSIWPIESQL